MNLISKICIPHQPVFEKITVTILGSCLPLGRTVALLLKQCRGVDVINLYGSDDEPCVAAVDLSGIDTYPKVIAYQGNNSLLVDSIRDANIILICGGEAERMGDTQAKLFEKNLDAVRYFALHVTEYNPNAILLLATPPINSYVPLISEEFKKAKVYDHRKIIGLSNIASMRSNALIGSFLNKDATLYQCPTIGGLCPKSIVPVFSQTTPSFSINDKDRLQLMSKIAYAESNILEKKFVDNTGTCYLSIALAITRFMKNLMDAMRGDTNCYECAYVRQMGHIGKFLPYMASICKLGPNGIEETYMPKLNAFECEQLQKAYPILNAAIQKGQSFVTGEVFRSSRITTLPSDYCNVLKKSPVEVVGDITVDLSRKYRKFRIYQ